MQFGHSNLYLFFGMQFGCTEILDALNITLKVLCNSGLIIYVNVKFSDNDYNKLRSKAKVRIMVQLCKYIIDIDFIHNLSYTIILQQDTLETSRKN